MKHVTALALLAPLLAACAPTYQQDSPHVTGRVLAAVDNRPIEGARLYYELQPDQVVQTNIQGYFNIPVMKSWHANPIWGDERFNLVALVIEANGFVTTTKPIPIGAPDPYSIQVYMQTAPKPKP